MGAAQPKLLLMLLGDGRHLPSESNLGVQTGSDPPETMLQTMPACMQEAIDSLWVHVFSGELCHAFIACMVGAAITACI